MKGKSGNDHMKNIRQSWVNNLCCQILADLAHSNQNEQAPERQVRGSQRGRREHEREGDCMLTKRSLADQSSSSEASPTASIASADASQSYTQAPVCSALKPFTYHSIHPSISCPSLIKGNDIARSSLSYHEGPAAMSDVQKQCVVQPQSVWRSNITKFVISRV